MKFLSFRILAALACISLTACQAEEEEGPKENPDGRTVLIYISGRNSLYANAARDSAEVVRGARNLDPHSRLLMYLCRDAQSNLYQVDRNGCTRVLTCSPEQNASDARQLEFLLKWTGKNFPSKSYGLVMWSHSNGWLPPFSLKNKVSRSFGVDVGANGNRWDDVTADGDIGRQMAVADMARAIEASGVRPEFIYFDSCLMLCIEAAYDLRKVTDWVIGSPAMVPAMGSDYECMVRDVFFRYPLDVHAFTREYVKQVQAPEYGRAGGVMAAVKTEHLERLAAVTGSMLQKYLSEKEADMTGVLAYDYYDYYDKWLSYRPEFYDMRRTMEQVITGAEDLAAWKEIFNSCVYYPEATAFISYWSNHFAIELEPGAFSGVSAFMPQKRYSEHAEVCVYGDLNRAFLRTEWAGDAGWKNLNWVNYDTNQ